MAWADSLLHRFNFKKSDGGDASAGNRHGHGFSFRTIPQSAFALLNTTQFRIAVAAMALTAGIVLAFWLIGPDSDMGSPALLGGLLVLAALVLYDIVSRRSWERTITTQLETLTGNHDRLVREVARNRNDIAIVKDGLADAANDVRDMGRHLAPGSSVEAKMIETIITQLAALGKKPATRILPANEVPAEQDDNAVLNGILELAVAPPPKIPRALSRLEAALNPDFSKFSDTVILDLVRHAVQKDHVDIFAQDVVSLPQRKPRFHELYARLRAGTGAYIPASRYMDLAQKESLIPAIDNLLLLRCLQMLRDQRDHDDALPYIVNIAPATLHDTGFMNDLVGFLSQNRALAARLVFELPLADLEKSARAVGDIIQGLSALGCRFSVDQVRRRRIDINRLRALHIRFIKLDAEWLIREAQQDGGNARIARMKTQLDKAGIDLIVERVENDAQLREILDFGIDYGQGFLFDKPDLYASARRRAAR